MGSHPHVLVSISSLMSPDDISFSIGLINFDILKGRTALLKVEGEKILFTGENIVTDLLVGDIADLLS